MSGGGGGPPLRSGASVTVATLVHLLGGLLALVGVVNGWLMLLAILPAAP